MDDINPTQKKTSKLAVASLVFSLIGLLFLGAPIFSIIYFVRYISSLWLFGIIFSISAIILSILSIIFINRKKGLITGKKIAVIALFISVLSGVFVLFIVMLGNSRTDKGAFSAPHFKATASSIVPAAVACCDENNAKINDFSPGGEICNPPIEANWPSGCVAKVTITKNCQDGFFELAIYPKKEDKCTCKGAAICNQEGCNFEDCN